jgi:hypothetical protein
MRVSVHCSVCGFSQRLNLRDLPDGRMVCPICEHEAGLPEERDLAEMERTEARQRTLTVLGLGAFFLGAFLALGCVVFSGAHPGEPAFGVGLVSAAAVLGLVGLVVTVMQESRTTENSF